MDSLADVSRRLGLVYDINSAHVIFNLAPRKEKEVVIYESNHCGLPNCDLSKAAFNVIRWWRENLGVTSYNMFFYLPPLKESLYEGDWCNFFPAIRLVERGSEGATTSDFGSMEIYGPAVVSADPFKLAKSFGQFLAAIA